MKGFRSSTASIEQSSQPSPRALELTDLDTKNALFWWRQGTLILHFCIKSCKAVQEQVHPWKYKQLHALAVKLAMNLNVYVGIALLDVYSKSGLIKDASCVFASLPERSEVTWSSMVAGYVQNGLYEEALMFFHRAKMMGLLQNQFTISSAICACVGLAALIEGKQTCMQNVVALKKLTMCFETCLLPRGDELFEKMQEMGRFPSEVTYVYVLTACSHMGLIESERKYFNLTEHNVSPTVVHYSCMIDLFGRSGLLFEVYNLIEEIPFDATASMWDSLLASCRIHGKLHLAEVAAKHLSEIEPNNAGKSWIEIKDKIHSFMVGEFRMLELLGYTQNWTV
ncbi:hypothetical protein L3X38_011401 [Prunus dulcis]|uniref:Tetratricopeptide repeat-like superfamily protein n=1 Tax=Prunus dulcis TaxID=3755 RepID=A0AAD4ZF15_PRUDU|nr:hypothetical protein L3X38_011401 [Prunus dulcis]